MTAPEDWRLTGQERYLHGRTFRRSQWFPYREGWDHDHCEFCWAEFAGSEGTPGAPALLAGYVTEDGYHWVCESCFEDFRERFGWSLTE